MASGLCWSVVLYIVAFPSRIVAEEEARSEDEERRIRIVVLDRQEL